jgi:hypothetical protein
MSQTSPPASEQNLAAMLLTVGAVTLAFLSVFVLTLDGVVLQILVGAVLSVGAISLIIVFALDTLGYFDEQRPASESKATEETPAPRSEPQRRANKPLAPLVNFDEEIVALKAHFDGAVPDQVRAFERQYRQLKQADRDRRQTIASDLRASMNPIEILVEDDPEVQSLVDGMGERLFRYIKSDAGDLLTLSDVELFLDGRRQDVPEVAGREARLKTSVYNEGEQANVEVALQFLSRSGVQVRREFLPVGAVQPNQNKTLDTRVYVPSNAKTVLATAVESGPGEPVLDL